MDLKSTVGSTTQAPAAPTTEAYEASPKRRARAATSETNAPGRSTRLTKSAAQIKLTRALHQGKALTVEGACALLGLPLRDGSKVRIWLNEIRGAVPAVKVSFSNGHTATYLLAETPIEASDLQHALLALRTARDHLHQLDGTALHRAFQAAETFVESRCTESMRQAAQAHRDLILRPRRVPLAPEQRQRFEKLLEAMQRERCVRFTYINRTERTREHTVRPYALIDHQGGFYLFCQGATSRSADKLLTFDLARFTSLVMTDDHFTRPHDCSELYELHRRDRFGVYVSDDHRPTDITLHVRSHALSFLTARPLGPGQRIEPPSSPQGWATLRVHLAPDPELLGHLLMLSPNVRVVRPRSLLDRLRATLTGATRENQSLLDT